MFLKKFLIYKQVFKFIVGSLFCVKFEIFAIFKISLRTFIMKSTLIKILFLLGF